MNQLQQRMPYTTAFPDALGTGIIIRSAQPISPSMKHDLQAFINEYDATLSRFRSDSLVGRMAAANTGGTFKFPDWTLPLFHLYDALHTASRGAIDPCVGEDLIRLGYGADMTFTVEPDAREHTGSIHGRPTWRNDVERHGTTLVTQRAVHLDFGACGKGYLVDLLARRLRESIGGIGNEWLIDAGGDMAINGSDATQPVSIGMEDPDDTSKAIGIAHMSHGSFCASAPSRRHWGAAYELHHLLNAIDGLPARGVAATWVAVNTSNEIDGSPATGTRPGTAPNTTPGNTPEVVRTAALANRPGVSTGTPTDTAADATFTAFPTAAADGLATALFVTEPDRLAQYFTFSCALLTPDRRAMMDSGFPGRFFTA
ncbi:FAD:protein FMN transferase [Bifidobacterium thermophilum]|nr:FAD:protein FMN transferase [Bifidobacterium thermophilum]